MLEKLPDAIGHALRGQRAGLEKLTFHQLGMRAGMGTVQVSSLAFADHAPIPVAYTADGPGMSPPLQWSGLPEGAISAVLIVEDADAPTPQPLVHAIVVGLRRDETALPQGAMASPDQGASAWVLGRNSFLQAAWLPPDPPPGHGVHRYAFQVFALNGCPEFSATPGRDEVVAALREHAIASGCLIGTYERPDGSIKAPDVVPTILTPRAG